MASPAQLMQTVSKATGSPLATVVDIDRKLAKAKLRTKGGRGFNAARMTPLDGARLLTAMLASPQATLAADAVARYTRTRVDQTRSSDTRFDATEISELAALPSGHGFIDALKALIGSAALGSLARQIATSRDGWTPHIEIFAFTRATRGRIRITGLPSGLTASVEYQPVTDRKPRGRMTRGRATAVDGDLEQSRRVTERTVLAIAELLSRESVND